MAATYDALLSGYKPTAWWKLADSIGATTARDSSGKGHPGTVHGTVTFGQTGPILGNPTEKAALFDGSTGYVTTTFGPTGTAFSVVAWIKVPSLPGRNCAIVASGNPSSTQNNFDLTLNSSNVPLFFVGNGTTHIRVAAASAITAGVWHELVGTLGSGQGRLYLDGSLVGGPTALAGSLTSTHNVWIGNNPETTGQYFPGYIAQATLL